jgi:hypothetical protein
MKHALIVLLGCLTFIGYAHANDHNPFNNEGKLEWIQVRHFIDSKEIPGAPKAILDDKGGVIVMPNYWSGFVYIPDCGDKGVKEAMASLKSIRWWSQFLPLIMPNEESDYKQEGGYKTPKGKRGLVPGGELFYANRQTQFIPNKEYAKKCTAADIAL